MSDDSTKHASDTTNAYNFCDTSVISWIAEVANASASGSSSKEPASSAKADTSIATSTQPNNSTHRVAHPIPDTWSWTIQRINSALNEYVGELAEIEELPHLTDHRQDLMSSRKSFQEAVSDFAKSDPPNREECEALSKSIIQSHNRIFDTRAVLQRDQTSERQTRLKKKEFQLVDDRLSQAIESIRLISDVHLINRSTHLRGAGNWMKGISNYIKQSVKSGSTEKVESELSKVWDNIFASYTSRPEDVSQYRKNTLTALEATRAAYIEALLPPDATLMQKIQMSESAEVSQRLKPFQAFEANLRAKWNIPAGSKQE